MTDNEIIKDLQSASKWFTEHGRNTNTAIIGICDRAVDLINRQKAEIERQKEYCLKCAERTTKAIIGLQETLGTARAEAIKEFAERLKASQIITHRCRRNDGG